MIWNDPLHNSSFIIHNFFFQALLEKDVEPDEWQQITAVSSAPTTSPITSTAPVGYVGYATFSISSVTANANVTILTNNLPSTKLSA